MYFTSFFPVFLIMLLYAMCGANQWARVMGFSAFFQAASPILVAGGGRLSGIAPTFCLMFIGIWHFYGLLYSKSFASTQTHSKSLALLLLFIFTIIGILGALFLPELLSGKVQVLVPREGLDSGFTTALKPSTTNYIQAFYLCCIFLLFFLINKLINANIINSTAISNGIVAGAAISVALGYYQVIAFHSGLPWPSEIINSNLGITQQQDQMAFGLKRMSSTFLEPSMMSMHFLGILGFLIYGLRRFLLGFLTFGALLLSTSSTAYFGIFLLIIFWLTIDGIKYKKQAVFIFFILFVAIIIAASLDLFFMNGQIADQFIFRKFQGSSGSARLYADALAINTLIQSYGLGTGVGSARASSLFATLAATVGIPGLLLFVAFLIVILVAVRREKSKENLAIFYGLIGLLIGWLISSPDLNFPLFWILAAMASASSKEKTSVSFKLNKSS